MHTVESPVLGTVDSLLADDGESPVGARMPEEIQSIAYDSRLERTDLR